jgi:8-oxo-dGTP pyrophosphatase MutT (NUDIX family)
MPPPDFLRRVGPWSVLGSRAIYSNAWISLREDRVIHPHGAEGLYGVLSFRHIAVGVVPLTADHEVILVGQHRYPLDYYSWEIPEGGGPMPNHAAGGASPTEVESAAEATAHRELAEETGYSAGRLDYLGCFALSNSVTDEIAHLYLARDLTPGEAQPEPTEILQVKSVPFVEACRMAEEGEINESLSVIALLRARHFLTREKAGMAPAPYRKMP